MENFKLGQKVEYCGGIYIIEKISTTGDVLFLTDSRGNHGVVRADAVTLVSQPNPKKHWWLRFRNVSWRIFVIMFVAYILFQLIRINL